MKRFFAKLLCAVLLLGAVLLLAAPTDGVAASKYGGGESYADANFRDLSQTFILMDGISIETPKVIEEYAKMNYCEIYKEKFQDDFEWSQFQKLLIQKVQSKKEYYRNLYQISGVIFLGRYNFDTQDFPFIKDSAIVNVGSLQLYRLRRQSMEAATMRSLCRGTEKSTVFPDHYVFELNQPLTFERLKLPMEEAKQLLERMDRMGNADRRLYVRFRMSVISILPIAPESFNASSTVRLRGELTAIDIFLDRDLTQPFATVEVK